MFLLKARTIIAALTIGLSAFAEAQLIEGQVSQIGDATHMEFSGKENWQYQVKRVSENEIEISLPQFSAETKDRLLNWTGQWIRAVKVDRYGSNGQAKITLALKNGAVDSFDYLTDQPSRLIIDVYEDPEKAKALKVRNKKAEAIAAENRARIKSNKSRNKFTKLNTGKRTPAGELVQDLQNYVENQEAIDKSTDIRFHKGVYDSGDPAYKRFKIKPYEINEEAIIASQQNIFIKFPMLSMSVNQLGDLLKFPPEYVIRAKNTEENKSVRLLKALFDKKRFGTYFKTKEFFDKKYPDSVYRQIVQFMTADVHFEKWLQSKDKYHLSEAEKLYSLVLREFPQTPLRERTKLLLAYTEVERGDGLLAFQKFQEFLKEFPDSMESDRVKMAMAESLSRLNKHADARKIYTNLMAQSRYPASEAEAAYRKGDTYFEAKNFKDAIGAYSSAIEDYKTFETTFPNAHFNKGEAYFWLGNYKEALNSYLKFIENFPEHKHNAYALTRVGETLGILGAHNKKVMGAYLESYFRFQHSPGSHIARIRLLSQKMEIMSEKELNKTLEEFKEISEKSPLDKINEFVTLMTTKGYRLRKDYDTALDYLVGYYQKNPTSANLDFFKKRIVDNIADSINEKISHQDFLSTLKIYSKYGNTWLMNVDRVDIDFFRGRAYELAGVFREADETYTQVLSKLQNIKGTREELERKVNEYLPTVDKLNLRLAKTNLEQRKYPEAFKSLSKIKGKSSLSASEQMERVAISAKVFEQRGDAKSAIGFLQKLIAGWQDDEALLVPAYLKMAELNIKIKNYVQAEVAADDTIALADQEEMSDTQREFLIEALQSKAESLHGQGRQLAAVEAYMSLLNRFEGEKPMEATRYKVGEILYGMKDLQGAKKVWGELDPEKSVFYNQLANEKLKSAEWENTYNKYIKRIPAMQR